MSSFQCKSAQLNVVKKLEALAVLQLQVIQKGIFLNQLGCLLLHS